MEQNMHTKSTCNTSELEGLDPLSTDTSELSFLSDWSSSSPGRNNELRLLSPLSMCPCPSMAAQMSSNFIWLWMLENLLMLQLESKGRIPFSLGDCSFLLRQCTGWTRPTHILEGNCAYWFWCSSYLQNTCGLMFNKTSKYLGLTELAYQISPVEVQMKKHGESTTDLKTSQTSMNDVRGREGDI